MQVKNSATTWAIGIGILVIALGLFFFTREDSSVETKESSNVPAGMVEVAGATAQLFEGQNILSYRFAVPESTTFTKEADGKTVVISDVNDGAQKALVYLSYEGARGYKAEDYFNNIIASKISATMATSTVHVGSYDWYHVETGTMMWDIASLKNGEWLMMIESKKTDAEMIKAIQESVAVE
jgi:hypothetical protein